jgi:hypothetical protein
VADSSVGLAHTSPRVATTDTDLPLGAYLIGQSERRAAGGGVGDLMRMLFVRIGLVAVAAVASALGSLACGAISAPSGVCVVTRVVSWIALLGAAVYAGLLPDRWPRRSARDRRTAEPSQAVAPSASMARLTWTASSLATFIGALAALLAVPAAAWKVALVGGVATALGYIGMRLLLSEHPGAVQFAAGVTLSVLALGGLPQALGDGESMFGFDRDGLSLWLAVGVELLACFVFALLLARRRSGTYRLGA